MSILQTALDCQIDGCEKRARYPKIQLCHMHYERLRRYGSTDPRPPQTYTRRPRIERFREKYIVNPETGCWEWLVVFKSHGYGGFTWDHGNHIGAHRASWLLLRGEIPDGLQIDHLCRVRHCVNPDHLELVTPRENTLRGETFAAANSKKTHCPQGHEYTPENIIWKHKGRSRACRECDRRYQQARRRRKKMEATA